MAAVFCASLRRSAMVRRSRVMRTRSSRGRRARGAARRGRRRGGGRERARRRAAPLQHVALGEAAVLAGGRNRRRDRRLFPSTSLRTAGPERSSTLALSRRARAPPPAAARAAAGAARRGRGFGAAPALPRPCLRRCGPAIAPTATLAPSAATISVKRAGGRRVDFERHLVGFELDQRIVHRDRVADLLEPARDASPRSPIRPASAP